MRSLVIISVLVATVCSSRQSLLTPTIITAQSPILSQYHSQDSLGQYAYGYNGGLSAKIESKSLDGVTRGSYSYLDADGRLQTVEYTADSINGFRAAATNLPKVPLDRAEPVRDTPEVQNARNEHIRAFDEALTRANAEKESNKNNNRASRLLGIDTNPNAETFSYTINTPADQTWPATQNMVSLPLRSLQLSETGPQDTPEVALAKLEHLRAVEDQKALIAATSQ